MFFILAHHGPQTQDHWPPFHPQRRRNGHDFVMCTKLHGHAHWAMEIRRFSHLHAKAGGRIYKVSKPTNDHHPKLLSPT